MKALLWLLTFAFGLTAAQAETCPDLLNFTAQTLRGKETVDFCKAYQGKVLLVGAADEVKNSKDSYVQQFIHGESEGVIPFKQTSEAYLKGLLST